jgi:cytidylate kinase
MGLRTGLVEGVDEKRANWVTGMLEAFTMKASVSEGAYLHHLGRVLLTLAAHGECIIVGRGAAQFLPVQAPLRVRLVAPLEQRARVIQERCGIGRDEAARRIKEADEDRTRFVKEHFGKDPTAAVDYDLILNTARFAPEECVDLIEQALRRFQRRNGATKGGWPG